MTDLSALVADPTGAAQVPVEELPALLEAVSTQAARLDVVKSVLAARLATAHNGPTKAAPLVDDLLDVHEAAKRLGMSAASLYRHADALPFTRRPRPRMLRFSAAGIQRYLDGRRPG